MSKQPLTLGQKVLRLVITIGLLLGLLAGYGSPAIALPNADVTQQAVTEIPVSLGNQGNELIFAPDRLTFAPGKRYKLLLTNPSPQKHYFTAKDFADSIWTQKVDAGNVEIKGAIRELELKPGATAAWVFVPLKPGTYDLHCAIAGHAAAGMKGTIVISVTPG